MLRPVISRARDKQPALPLTPVSAKGAPSPGGMALPAADSCLTTAGGATDGPLSAIGQNRKEAHMPLYEHVFLARQDLAQTQVDGLAEAATKIIEDNGGKVAKVETWGLRNIAYRIRKNRRAHYVLMDIDAPAPAIAELERQTSINEDVIRYMTLRVDAHEAGPSVMMRKGDRDRERRGERGDRGAGCDRGDRGDSGDRGPIGASAEVET